MLKKPATDQEARVLVVLAGMVDQYLRTENGVLDHMCMGAGERAMEVLVDYWLVTEATRHGRWTADGLLLTEN